MSDAEGPVSARLNVLLREADLRPLDSATALQFEAYLSLILRWNARMNLTAIRDEERILSRHFVESIVVAQELPREVATLLDFGSGAGLPGIPIALCRPEIAVTLAEAQGKKAAFLREAVRMLRIPVKVHAERAETLADRFDSVALRAVDRMTEAVKSAVRLIRPGGWLALMTTEGEIDAMKVAAGAHFVWQEPVFLAGGEHRVIALGNEKS
jgi:16S rRNA (guanine527-N7)-methyltransferase